MTRIRFHIGAHKTATTHLQMTLARCRLERGTRYPPVKPLRRLLTSPVRKGRPHLPWHRWLGGNWLFSDENILGTTANALEMYPQPDSALRYFCDCDLHIFLCVRSYDTFLPSAWGERLWHHRVNPFEAFIPRRRWTDVVADLQAAMPQVPIHVWRYEDYCVHPEAITRYYAGFAIRSFPPALETKPKSGFSAKAIAELGKFAGSHPGRKRIRRIREQYPAGPDFPRFDPWTREQKETLQRMYHEDCETLKARVNVWHP